MNNNQNVVLPVNKLAIGKAKNAKGEDVFVLQIDDVNYGFTRDAATAIGQGCIDFIRSTITIQIQGAK